MEDTKPLFPKVKACSVTSPGQSSRKVCILLGHLLCRKTAVFVIKFYIFWLWNQGDLGLRISSAIY